MNQAIAFMLADMATEIDAARLLVWRAAWLARNGGYTNAEGSMSKLKAGRTAVWVTERAIQILGGYGYTREYPVERWHRDAKIYRHLRGHRADPAAGDRPGHLRPAHRVGAPPRSSDEAPAGRSGSRRVWPRTMAGGWGCPAGSTTPRIHPSARHSLQTWSDPDAQWVRLLSVPGA